MDMRIFQVKSNKALPHTGSILIASPLLYDYHFARSVVLMITHNSEGSMGIVMNKDFRYHISLNQLVPNLETAPLIPVYKGGPVDRSTIFFLHTLPDLEGSFPLGNGLFLMVTSNVCSNIYWQGIPSKDISASLRDTPDGTTHNFKKR